MKKVLVPIGIIILGVGGFFYFQWTRSPKYSLNQVRNSIDEHDITTFEKYVDVEGFTQRLIDQLLEFTSNQQGQNAASQYGWGNELAKGLITLLKPQLAKLVREQIAYYVEKGSFDVSSDSLQTLRNIWSSGAEKSEFRGIRYTKKEGKIAVIGLGFFQKEYDTMLTCDIKMRNKGNYWQVAEISNLGDLLRKIQELQEAKIEKLNQPIVQQMGNSFNIQSIHKSAITDEWKIDKKIIIRAVLSNAGEKEIYHYELDIEFRTPTGNLIKKVPVMDATGIKPQETKAQSWAIEVNMFDSGDNLLYDTAEEYLRIFAKPTYIRFNDGQTLKLYQ